MTGANCSVHQPVRNSAEAGKVVVPRRLLQYLRTAPSTDLKLNQETDTAGIQPAGTKAQHVGFNVLTPETLAADSEVVTRALNAADAAGR